MAVVDLESEKGVKRLAAYLVSQEGEIDVPALRNFLKSKLPEYMVPAAFVPMDRLPLTANQKVDRRALPKPDFSAQHGRTGNAEDRIMARTPVELQIAEIWSDVLELAEPPAVDENFFDLGGTSLSAAHLIARTLEVCAVQVPLSGVFENPTVAGIASLVEALTGEDPEVK